MEITECKWLAHNGQKPDEEEMLGGAVVVNDEYKQIDWQVKNPENRISTIHAF